MKAFFIFSLGYAAFAAGLAVATGGTGSLALSSGAAMVGGSVTSFLPLALGAVCLSIILARVTGMDARAAMIRVGWATGGSVLFFPAFSTIKRTLPDILPFWADPPLAAFDRALHGGVDPWVLTHMVQLPGDLVQSVYLYGWSVPAFLFPLVAAIDPDRLRAGRAMALFVAAWVFLGNVVALLFMSAGPVYYDRLLGAEEFVALTDAISADHLLLAGVGATQEALWDLYATGTHALGSGISAFPSVHVATITAVGLYMIDLRRWLIVPAVALIALFQFLSVYTGWHYAVDGYASIAVLAGLWAVLLSRSQRVTQFRHDGVPAE